MEEKYKKFKEFNWVESEEWQAYYRNLYPTPPPSKILRYKKKFYRNKIDEDFDIDYKPPGEEETNPTTGSSTSSNTNTSSNYTNQSYQQNFTPEQTFETYNAAQSFAHPINSSMLVNIETALMVLFMISLPLRIKTTLLAVLAFGVRTVRTVGIPQFNLNYLQALVMNDNFHTLIFAGQTLVDRFNYYMMVPVAVSALIALADNLKKSNINIGGIKKHIDTINQQKENLIQDKTHIEVAIGFISVAGIFLKLNSILTPVIYWQMMKVRYTLNPYIKQSFKELNQYTNNFKNSNKCPGPLKFVIEKIQWAFNYMGQVNTVPQNGQGSNQGAGSMCNVF